MLDLELDEFLLTYFPKDKKVMVYSYGNIYQQETNFKIALILKEMVDNAEPEYFLRYINLKDMANFPIGSIIDNGKKLDKFGGKKVNLILNLENIESKIMLEISKLKKELVKPTFPEKIGNFNSKFHVQGQYYFILKDENTNKNVYIPHYEVARWFYFTTPSMTKQILSASLNEESSMLKGLYKNIIHINSKFKEITLTQNANTKDAANIFRYVTNKYANNCWYQVRRNLTASGIELKNKQQEKGYINNSFEMKIKVDFPIKEEISLNARVKVLEDGSFLVLKFINEDSIYDFETLFVQTERRNKTKEFQQVIRNVKPAKGKLSKKITDNTPNEEFNPIVIDNESIDFEERLDLKSKSIRKSLKYIDECDISSLNNKSNSDKKIDLSTKYAESNGSDDTAGVLIENENPEVDDREYLSLTDFKNMLFECSKENNEFSFFIQIEDYLPQKPENNMNKKRKWRKSKLLDNKTKRKYLAVSINYDNKNFTLIEIERDLLVDGLSTLIIWRNDYSKIDNLVILSVVRNFVYESGRWVKNYDEYVFNWCLLEHPKDENKNRMKEWYSRLLAKTRRIIK